MTPRELATLCERASGFDAHTLRLLADTLRAQADEIAALKAAAIVQGNIKLAEWAKWETRREAVKAAWKRITSSQGWLSCVEHHDMRCPANGIHYPECGCRCGADAYRKLMDG